MKIFWTLILLLLSHSVSATLHVNMAGIFYLSSEAKTSAELSRGFMYRPYLLPFEAKLFYLKGQRASFWMRNTLTPLHIFYLDACGRVLEAHLYTPPCLNASCPTYSSQHPHVFYALELPAALHAFSTTPLQLHPIYTPDTAPYLAFAPTLRHPACWYSLYQATD